VYLDKRLAFVEVRANFFLQDKAGTMVDAFTFPETACAKMHTRQAELFSVDSCEITTLGTRKHVLYGGSWEEKRLLNLARVATLRGDYFGKFGETSTGMDGALHQHIGLGNVRSFPRHDQEFRDLVVAKVRYVLWPHTV